MGALELIQGFFEFDEQRGVVAELLTVGVEAVEFAEEDLPLLAKLVFRRDEARGAGV